MLSHVQALKMPLVYLLTHLTSVDYHYQVVVLPSDMSETKVYKHYKAACVQQQLRHMKKSAFFKVWQDLHANIGTMKPATDLSFECQQFLTQII